MDIAITGYKGYVASALFKSKLPDGMKLLPMDCDVTKPETIETWLSHYTPDIVVHLAAKSGVDYCQDFKNQDVVIKTNAEGTYNVCFECDLKGIPLIYLSTDHVFAGNFGPYSEHFEPTHDWPPKNFYGLTKYTAETFIRDIPKSYIVRTSTLFSYARPMIQEYLEPLFDGKEVYPPDFIYRSFMYLPHFAESFLYYLSHLDKMPRVLNISGSDTVSWFDFVWNLVLEGHYGDNIDLVQRRIDDNGSTLRPKRGGLKTKLSAKLGLPQYGYEQGIEQMVIDNG